MVIVIKEVYKKCEEKECLWLPWRKNFKEGESIKLRNNVKEFAKYTSGGRIFNTDISAHAEV